MTVTQVPTEGGGTVDYGARRPLTFGIDIPWPNFDGHLIVLGLSFLDRCAHNILVPSQF